ncbi:MAG: 6-carboxytetrahydropterin synthase QueD [Nitrosomonas sp.]|jgi:6-pyruvoyltetrahydropterin/6-carboxytetrahydropterin synthase|nr:6-carboxytetrahydropterin synthase QueD [Nitrosomonas sp.]MCC7135757.1 6-carboxytetrahydropterin synthase QueD [Nitrosomonas sp.]
MLITRKFEFDAGHRISTHASQCRNLHGHRYVLEITLSGKIVSDEGVPEQGMVMDFSQIKSIVHQALINQWDHAFLVYAQDKVVLDFLLSIPEHKTVVLDLQPTAENLALIAFDILDHAFRRCYMEQLQLDHVRLFETPNCWADVARTKAES